VKIEQYISELLYKYDCVIVPGLGGFVANYKSATIRPIQNTFSPPSKSISFNKNLNNNDGLLANFIAQKEGSSFDVATKRIEEYVANINRGLKLKKRVLLDNIGTLFLDLENRTQFEPQNTTNYLLESYGLPIYQKQPINRTTIEEKITKEFIDRAAPLVAVKDGEKKKSKKWMYSAALIFLAFGAGWMANNSNLSGDLNYANLNPFIPNAKAVYTPVKSNNTVAETKLINLFGVNKRLISLDVNYNIKIPFHFFKDFGTPVCSTFVRRGCHYRVPTKRINVFKNTIIICCNNNLR